MCKKIVFAVGLSLVTTICCRAQQLPQYTQYLNNNYILNPALAGIENYTDVKLSHRHQWAGMQDAPVTSYLTIHTAIGKKDDRTTATSFDMPDENPRGHNFWEQYEAAKPHHGIGIKLINDRTGPLNNFAGYLSYAYHIGISRQTSIAVGFDAGLKNVSLNRDKLDFGVANPVDPAVYNSGTINSLRPDFGAGIWIYSASYFIGASALQIIPQKIYFSDDRVKMQEGELVPHFFGTAGYRFFLDDDISMLPSVMVKYISPLPTQVDINVKCQYRDLCWVGGGYRIKDGFNAMLGLNISNTFNVSYAYDYTTSPLNNISKGTHELVLGFLLGNRYGDWCPRNIW